MAISDPPFVVSRSAAAYYLKNQDQLLVPPSIHHRIGGKYFDSLQDYFLGKGLQNEKAVRQWTAIYYGMVSQVDAQVGELLDELARQKVDKHTLGKCTMAIHYVVYGMDPTDSVVDRSKDRQSKPTSSVSCCLSLHTVWQFSLRQITESTFQRTAWRYVRAAERASWFVGGREALHGICKPSSLC